MMAMQFFAVRLYPETQCDTLEEMQNKLGVSA
jgi:hypothetical protein